MTRDTIIKASLQHKLFRSLFNVIVSPLAFNNVVGPLTFRDTYTTAVSLCRVISTVVHVRSLVIVCCLVLSPFHVIPGFLLTFVFVLFIVVFYRCASLIAFIHLHCSNKTINPETCPAYRFKQPQRSMSPPQRGLLP